MGRRRRRRDRRYLRKHVVDTVTDHGARGDTRVLTDSSIEAAQKRLTSASAEFTSADVGKSVIVPDAGGTVITGSFLSGSDQITNVRPISGYCNGSLITGPGIPAGTRVLAGAGSSTLTLSQRTTAPATVVPLVAQGALCSVIGSVTRGVAILASTAGFPVQTATVSCGTDSTVALAKAIAEGAAQGRAVYIPAGNSQVIGPVVSGLAAALGDSDGRSGVGVYFVQGADRGRLRGGRIANVPYGIIVRGSSDVSIVGTRLQNVLRYGIYIQDDGAYPTPANLRIDDVDIVGSPLATGIEFEVWDASTSLSRVRCRGLAADVLGQGAPD